MLLPYHQLAEHSRVWIYQADRSFTAEELNEINIEIEAFVAQWQSHQREVQGYGAVYYRRFIVLMADETQVDMGGCSIDNSIKFIKELGAKYHVNFFDRMTFCYKIEEQLLGSFNLKDIEKVIATRELKGNSLIFNNLVSTKKEFETNWEVKAENSFFSKYFSMESN